MEIIEKLNRSYKIFEEKFADYLKSNGKKVKYEQDNYQSVVPMFHIVS